MMSYEELLKIAGAARLEAMEEQMQMLSLADVGRKAYREISGLYSRFGKTGDMASFEAVADRLAAVTGCRI